MSASPKAADPKATPKAALFINTSGQMPVVFKDTSGG